MNLPQLDNLIHYVNLMCYANFLYSVYRIPYHFSHSINGYSCILYLHYILRISYIYDSCLINPYLFIFFFFNMCHAFIFQRSGYEKGLYVLEGTITVRDNVLYKMGLTISVCCNNCIPNRHAHLSIYLVISRQSVSLRFQYISHIHE